MAPAPCRELLATSTFVPLLLRTIWWQDDSLSSAHRLGSFRLAVGVEDRQQRRRDQDSPERNDEPHDDRYKRGCPPWHAILPLHQIGLKDQSVDDGNECVGDEQSDEALPIGPGEQNGHCRADEREDSSEVGYELKGSGE